MVTLKQMCEDDVNKIVKAFAGEEQKTFRYWAGRSYVYPLTTEQLENRLRYSFNKKSGFKLYTFFLGKTPVGMAELCDINEKEKRASLAHFAVSPKVRRQGIGLEALKLFMKNAKENEGVEELAVWVYEVNVAAQRLYEKAGFMFEEFVPDLEGARWNTYKYIAELYSIDMKTFKRLNTELDTEYLPEAGEVLDIYTY